MESNHGQPYIIVYLLEGAGVRCPLSVRRELREDASFRPHLRAAPRIGNAPTSPCHLQRRMKDAQGRFSSRRASVRHFAKGLRGARWINPSRGWDWLLSSLGRLHGPLPCRCELKRIHDDAKVLCSTRKSERLVAAANAAAAAAPNAAAAAAAPAAASPRPGHRHSY